MGAAYTIGGVLIGVMVCKTSAAEGPWALLIAPAAISFIVGWVWEWERRR